MATHNMIYIAPSHTKKIFANMRRQGKDFSGRETPLFPNMVVQAQEEMGEGSAMPTDPRHYSTIIITTSKETKVSRSRRVESSKEASLHDQEDASKQGRKIDDIDADAEITLVDETQGRHDDDLMFDISVLNDEEVFVGQDMAEKEVSTADPVTTANVEVSTASPTAATITNVELTLAQTLAELKSARPKTKGVVMQEPSESTPTISLQLPSQVKGQGSKDKGKAKMIEPEKPLKKKDQIKFDEELAFKLQAEEDEEERLAREKA
ncbi:hypothetical protein Tco_0774248 [Tanacetum coccineum]|uniref:Uncharacterized protein n=1 Tax=Tanacetum coccineum TaxID=301880 RepID=A0ABQ4ZR25_9ASTR